MNQNCPNVIFLSLEYVQGQLTNLSKELLSKAAQLQLETPCTVVASLISETDQPLLGHWEYLIDVLYILVVNKTQAFVAKPIANVLCDFIQKTKANIVLFADNPVGKALATQVAVFFKTGLTADCTALFIEEDNRLIQVRPAFSGNVLAKIITKTDPQICTVREGVFEKITSFTPKQKPTTHIHTFSATDFSAVQLLNKVYTPQKINNTNKEFAIVVGDGFKQKEDLKLVEPLAQFWNCTIYCTRALVEKGWLSSEVQVGLSGRRLTQQTILTLGVSGSVQFLEGVKKVKNIIAVNNDVDAPIFLRATNAFEADLYTLLLYLTKSVSKNKDK